MVYPQQTLQLLSLVLELPPCWVPVPPLPSTPKILLQGFYSKLNRHRECRPLNFYRSQPLLLPLFKWERFQEQGVVIKCDTKKYRCYWQPRTGRCRGYLMHTSIIGEDMKNVLREVTSYPYLDSTMPKLVRQLQTPPCNVSIEAEQKATILNSPQKIDSERVVHPK